MKFIATRRLSHDGEIIEAGEILECEKKAALGLINCGAVIPKRKPKKEEEVDPLEVKPTKED